MPQTIQQATPTLAQFQKMADETSEKGSIVFKNGSLVSRGQTGTVFSRHATRRAAVDALLRSITETHGTEVADMLSGTLSPIGARGKPLRASMVRDAIAQANTARVALNFRNGAYDDAVYAFATKHGLGAEQVQELKEAIQREAALRPRLLPGADGQQHFEDISQKVEDGLPCMKALVQMLKPGKSPALPFLFYTPGPDERSDIAWLQAFVPQAIAECASAPEVDLCYILQRMPDMRRMQPHGPLSLTTVWKACFDEAPPPHLDVQSPDLPKAWGQRLKRLVADTLKEHNLELKGNYHNVFTGVISGLKLDVAVARLMRQAPITLQDMCRRPTALLFDAARDTLATVEAGVAIDMHRQVLPWPDFDPTFTFTTRDGTKTTLHPMSEQGLNPGDKEQWSLGKPSQRSREVMEAAARLCGPDRSDQALVVALCFTQSAIQLPKFFIPFTGVNLTEHTAYNISAEADAEGNVHVHFKTPENWHSHHEMTVLIRPDGSNEMTSFEVRRNADNVRPQPARVPHAEEPEVSDTEASEVDASSVISTDFYEESSTIGTATGDANNSPVPGRTVKSEAER